MHPLTESFFEARQQLALLKAYRQLPGDDGWHRPASWLSPESLDALCNETARRYQTTSAVVVGQVLLAGYQWGLLITSLACYLRDRRVPGMAPETVWLHWNGAHLYVDEVTYEGGRFACLPQDPAATHPQALVMPDKDALRDYLRRQLEAHFEATITRICAHIGLRPRALWLTLADRCAATMLWLGQQPGGSARSPGALQREVQALLGSARSPLHNKTTGIMLVQGRDEMDKQPFLKRAACCQAYRLAGYDYCDTCPHLPLEERLDRVCSANGAGQKVGAET